MPPRQTLKARYVFPVTAEPMGEGTVTIEGERIVGVGTATTGSVRDLGNVAILPGFVNAHTHFELSDFREPVGWPGIGFAEWVEQVVVARRQMAYAPRQAVEKGIEESARQGVTGIGEIAQPGWPSEPFENARVDATVFLELIAPTPSRVETALELARQHVRAARQGATWRPGLSPHAPYSVRPELLSAVVALSASEHVPVAFHLAESREELELLRSGTGPLRGFLERLGAWDSQQFSQHLRPLDYLAMLADSHRVLVIHGNYLDKDEIAFLARHADRMAVVYCPRTHAWFRHAAYPLSELLAAGVTVALGTDSRASSPDLGLLAEMRLAARTHSDVPPRTILELGTLQSARALGCDREVGSLEPGKRADLAVVALPEREAADPHELLFHSDGPVVARWHRGREDA